MRRIATELPWIFSALALAISIGVGVRSERQHRALAEVVLAVEGTSGSGSTAMPAIPSDVEVSTWGAASLGRSDAPLTLVYFTDFRCSFCREFALTTLQYLRRSHVEQALLKIVVRDLPQQPGSEAIAQAARCAGKQERYWEYHDRLFDGGSTSAREALIHLAGEVGLDIAKFQRCLDSAEVAHEIAEDARAARGAGLIGTPAFVVGRSPANGRMRGTVIMGAQPLAVFRDALDHALAPTGAPAP
jgi:protein-disulfide isomerase